MKKQVNVVIPMYNSEYNIKKVLDALIRQTKVERIKKIIVINDGSEDNSLEEVIRYKKNSKVPIEVYTQENKGVSAARNLGMSKVLKGEWIAFCDSDDLWIENKLDLQLKILDENEDIDFLGGAMDEKELKIGRRKINSLYKGNVRDILIKNFPQPSTVILKSEIFYELGGFDEQQRYAEDGNYFLKICNKYNLYYMPTKLIIYGEGKRGFGVKGLSSNLKKMYDGNIKNLKEMKPIIGNIFYFEMRIFHFLKYVRRIIISKLK